MARLRAVREAPHAHRMFVIRRFSGLIALAVAPTCVSAAQATAAQGVWTEVRPIDGISKGDALKSPSVAVRHDTLIIAGNVFPIARDANIAPQPAVLLRSPGAAIPLPAGKFTFARPRVAIGRDGTIHLVWAEFPSVRRTLAQWSEPATSLWYARRRGSRWSAPERVLHGTIIDWSADQGALVSGASGGVDILVPITRSPGVLQLVYLRRTHKGWRETVLHGGAAYATMAATGRQGLIAAFVAADTTLIHDVNSLFVTRSADGGLHWSVPVVTGRVAGSLAHAPRFVVSGDTVHLLWIQRGARGDHVAIRHERSADGAIWTSASAPPAPTGTILHLDAAPSSCGDVLVVADVLRANGVLKLTVVESLPGNSSAPMIETFPQARQATSAALVADRGSIRLVATVAEGPEYGGRAISARWGACRGSARPE